MRHWHERRTEKEEIEMLEAVTIFYLKSGLSSNDIKYIFDRLGSLTGKMTMDYDGLVDRIMEKLNTT